MQVFDMSNNSDDKKKSFFFFFQWTTIFQVNKYSYSRFLSKERLAAPVTYSRIDFDRKKKYINIRFKLL